MSRSRMEIDDGIIGSGRRPGTLSSFWDDVELIWMSIMETDISISWGFANKLRRWRLENTDTQCKKNGKNVSFAMTMMSIKPFKLPRSFKKFVLEQSNYFLSSENLTFSKVCAPHEALNSKEAYKNVFTINDLNKKFRCANVHSPSSFNRNCIR